MEGELTFFEPLLHTLTLGAKLQHPIFPAALSGKHHDSCFILLGAHEVQNLIVEKVSTVYALPALLALTANQEIHL